MQIPIKQLKPISGLEFSPDEKKILGWLKGAKWEATPDGKFYKTKVPQFYGGVRLYGAMPGRSSASGLGALELFIKKLEYQGIITKQELYPLAGHDNNSRFLSLKKVELDNLGVGEEEE